MSDFRNAPKKPDPDNRKKPQKPRSFNFVHILLVGFLITFILNSLYSTFMDATTKEITYSQFIKLVESDCVEIVVFEPNQLLITLKESATQSNAGAILSETAESNSSPSAPVDGNEIQRRTAEFQRLLENNTVFYTGRLDNPDLYSLLYEHDVDYTEHVIRNNPIMQFIATWILPIVMIYVLFTLFSRFLSKRMGNMGGGGFGGMMDVGKSTAKLYNLEKSTHITFADVAGQEEAKESLTEIIDFLHNPAKYKKIGAKQPKGALLVGPPGTGKTLLAKAVAGEGKVPFFSLSGSEFVEMFVGVGAKRVRDLFQQAAKNAPCIIFIDEIDAIGKSRDNQLGGNDEREQTLNQLLAEMDGFDSSKGIVILAATNRPDTLDKALLRPGRFDRRVIVEKPDLPGREAILKLHAAKVLMNPSVNLKEIALSTSGATGADLANMINEAALRAVRMNRDVVLQEDLMEAVEVVIAGKEKKDRIMNATEKRMVAFHEVGHALVSALQKHSQPVQKITIIPRTMGSLGYTMQMPEEERYLMTKNELLAQICVLLGGRAAEEVVFSEMTTGASNDIERATQLARNMVTQYGMSENFGMMGLESIENRYLDGRSVSTCSEATGAQIDEEIKKILINCYSQSKQLLEENRQSLGRISKFLLEKESITGEQFMEILHEKPLLE